MDILVVVKLLNPLDYSLGREILSTWSKTRTPCRLSSHKGLALSWHGDSRNNGHNGAPELGAPTGQSPLQFQTALCCMSRETLYYSLSKTTSHMLKIGNCDTKISQKSKVKIKLNYFVLWNYFSLSVWFGNIRKKLENVRLKSFPERKS